MAEEQRSKVFIFRNTIEGVNEWQEDAVGSEIAFDSIRHEEIWHPGEDQELKHFIFGDNFFMKMFYKRF